MGTKALMATMPAEAPLTRGPRALVSVRARAAALGVALCVLVAVALGGCGAPVNASSGGKLQVVAAENFWGSIASQLGGTRVNVTSIVNNPNADPHEYQSNTVTARTLITARYVILNGAGYDSWARNMLDANSVDARKVLTVATLLGKKNGDNPHFWYDPDDVTAVANQITKDYQALDPPGASYFAHENAAFQTIALKPYHDTLAAIKARFAGQRVGSTESIFAYMAQSLGLDLISPPDFMDAVSEGNDPPAASVATFEQQLQQQQITVLVYNTQTSTNITNAMRQMATQAGIPVVGMSETLEPVGATFQAWQVSQLDALETALSAHG